MTSRNGLGRPAHVAFGSSSTDRLQRCKRSMSAAPRKRPLGRKPAARRSGPGAHSRAASNQYLYSIISSARPLNGSGTVMPSTLAVLRLMYSSTFAACWTGSSAGFSPLRIRPV